MQPLFPEIDDMYKKHAEKHGYPGYAYGIVLDGQLVHTGSGGSLTPQSMFRIASMTKSFTAMAIVKLRDEGKLALDDPISLYIPEMPRHHLTQDSPPITIRDLLVHSAGFPTDDPWADRKLEETEEQLLALLKGKLCFSNPCSTVFEYSNLGYAILGYLINKIVGIPYQEYIDAAICRPLGIQSYWEYTDVPEMELVRGFSFKDGKREEEPLLHDGIFGAMGGLITSVESFARYIAFHQAALPPRDDAELGPIKRSSIREMHQPWKFIKNDSASVSAYGYGLKWLRDVLGRVFVGHRGGLPGFGSNWFFLPEYGLGVVFFANLTYADTSKLDLDILNKLLVESQLQPRQVLPGAALTATRHKLVSLLSHWENIPEGLFAGNFFLDRSLKTRKQESKALFAKAGNILSISPVIPENQLRGHFTLRGSNADLQIHFSLTPEHPCLIQQLSLRIC